MPEQFRALIVILGLTLPVFWLAHRPACELAIGDADFRRRRNLWVAITVLAFLAHDFWIYVAVSAVMLAMAAPRDSNRFAMFLFLLLAIPPFSKAIPGFGGIRQLFGVDHPRMLSIVLLFPAYLALRRESGALRYGRTLADKFLLAYMIVPLAWQYGAGDSATNTARSALYSFTDVFLPYYVASRALRHLDQWRDAMMSLVVAVLLVCAVAVFEYGKGWLLYSSLTGALGVEWGLGNYLGRAGSLRAVATAGHSIVMGYLAMIGLAMFIFVHRFVADRRLVKLAFVLMLLALPATGARGPWVGALVVFIVALLTGEDRLGRFKRVFLIGLPVLGLMLLTPLGGRVADYLPFIGTVDADNVAYRQRLFTVSMQVIGLHPWLGSFDTLGNPLMQELIQGEGIIDLVNSYIVVTLNYGYVGLALFSGVFLASGAGAWRAMRNTRPGDDSHALGRALIASLLGMLVTISTVSSISLIPWFYWIVAGLCTGYAQTIPKRSQREGAPMQSWATQFAPRA